WIARDDIALVEDHHPGQVVVYEEAGHGFMRDGSESYDEAAAADAWAAPTTAADEGAAADPWAAPADWARPADERTDAWPAPADWGESADEPADAWAHDDDGGDDDTHAVASVAGPVAASHPLGGQRSLRLPRLPRLEWPGSRLVLLLPLLAAAAVVATATHSGHDDAAPAKHRRGTPLTARHATARRAVVVAPAGAQEDHARAHAHATHPAARRRQRHAAPTHRHHPRPRAAAPAPTPAASPSPTPAAPTVAPAPTPSAPPPTPEFSFER
ncbi:MAG TPA: dienelactone hydrolase family protein, partial [Conexibacter sp.]|nr:dienelactone hydrolase family protein [Conexibacter sp.]